MRFTLVFLLLAVTSLVKGQALHDPKIRFDGFYQAKADKHENDSDYYYLRFYASGRVISVTSDGTPDDLKTWFNLSKDDIPSGSYKITGKKIYFSTVNKHGGSVIYNGKIKNRYDLVLRFKSLINGHKGRDKYHFVAVPDLN
jgi:hypothetical protein